jgi:hypothetical protein
MEYLTADLPRAQMEGLSPAKAGSSPSSSKTFMQDLKDRGLMLTKGIDDKFAWQYDSFWGGLGKVMLKQLSPGSVLNYALKGLAYELTKDKSENEKLLGAALASAASGIGGYYLNEAIGTSWAGNLKNNKGEIYNPYHRDESNVFKNVWARNILDAAAGAALDKIILETGQPQLTTLAKSALAWGASSVLLEAKTALGTYLAYDPTHDPKYLKDFLPPTYSFGQATTDSFIKSLALWYPLPQNVNGGGVGVYVKRQMKFWGLDNIKLLEAAKRNGGQVLYNNYILPEFSDFLRDEAAGNFVSSLLGPDGKESRAMKYWGDVPSTGSRVEAIKGIGISGK